MTIKTNASRATSAPLPWQARTVLMKAGRFLSRSPAPVHEWCCPPELHLPEGRARQVRHGHGDNHSLPGRCYADHHLSPRRLPRWRSMGLCPARAIPTKTRRPAMSGAGMTAGSAVCIGSAYISRASMLDRLRQSLDTLGRAFGLCHGGRKSAPVAIIASSAGIGCRSCPAH
jgi:hypothetical protein